MKEALATIGACAGVAVVAGVAQGAALLGAGAVGAAVPKAMGVVKDLHKDKWESTSAYEAHDVGSQWIVAIEKGPGNVRVVRFATESEAREWFKKSWSMRELYSPTGELIESAGWNPWSHATIRREGRVFCDVAFSVLCVAAIGLLQAHFNPLINARLP
jgi:hypothetical protein